MNELIASIKELADGVISFVKPTEPVLEFFRKVTQRYTVKLNEDGTPVIGEDGKPVLIPDGKPFKEVRLYSSKFKAYDKKAGRSVTIEGYLPFNKRLALILVKLGFAEWTSSSGLTEEEDDAIFGEVEESAWIVDDQPAPKADGAVATETAVISE